MQRQEVQVKVISFDSLSREIRKNHLQVGISAAMPFKVHLIFLLLFASKLLQRCHLKASGYSNSWV